jgi:peptidoglycan hydrolase-like protein with peptidoglycan-binding domain
MSRKRLLMVLIVLGIVVLASAGIWVLGSRIQSPAEAAARIAPPTPSPILVPVEERVLTSNVVTRGTARFGLPQSISIVPSSLKAEVGIVSTLPARNTQIQEGDVLLTASGRPVFVLQGAIPVFRDLATGVSGEDVRQLESGLERLGFDPGPVDGNYDEQTGLAVADWYASAGFEMIGPTDEQQANIHALEDELAIARDDMLAAQEAAAAAPLAVEAAQARAAYELATADLSSKSAVQLAGEVAIQAAIDAQQSAGREAKRLGERVDRLAADLEIASSQARTQVPADELVFIPTLPVRVEGSDVAVGDAARGPAIKVTNNQIAIDSSLPLDEAPLVKPGMSVLIDEPDLGIEATGVVERVASTPGTDGVDGFHIYFEVLVDETPVALEGFSLRLTIPVESTGGKVTVVPVSALSLAADGTTRLQVEKDGALEVITVEPGLSADGFVAVTPVEGTLTPGQLVVIGFENNP